MNAIKWDNESFFTVSTCVNHTHHVPDIGWHFYKKKTYTAILMALYIAYSIFIPISTGKTDEKLISERILTSYGIWKGLCATHSFYIPSNPGDGYFRAKNMPLHCSSGYLDNVEDGEPWKQKVKRSELLACYHIWNEEVLLTHFPVAAIIVGRILSARGFGKGREEEDREDWAT